MISQRRNRWANEPNMCVFVGIRWAPNEAPHSPSSAGWFCWVLAPHSLVIRM